MTGKNLRWARAGRRGVWAVGVLAVALAALIAATGSGAATTAAKATASFTPAPALAPIDAQNWKWQDDLSWNDYHPLPGPDYSDASIQPTVKLFKAAIVFTDFDDKQYAITQPAGSTVFGNPQQGSSDIPRANVPTFLRDFLNTPSALNHYQTLNRYWMEDSFGKYGVQLDSFGVYRLPGKSWQYFNSEYAPANGTSAGSGCVTYTVTPCNKDFRTDALAAWKAGTGNATIQSNYSNTFFVSPGQDESGSWQEFGNMRWTQTTVPDAFGPKAVDATTSLPNWMQTRYVPWTSWAAGETIWPNATTSGTLSSIEGESSGMAVYAHEFSHNLNILDNYNNPYGSPVQRSATGPWDMMSRGSFGGAGGPHQRFLIPPTQGASLGSNHNLRNKAKLAFVTNANLLRLNRNGVATTGLLVAKVKAREVPPGPGELSGVTITLDGTAPVDKAPTCTNTVASPNALCATPAFTGESVEVVQQIGSDSFDPGHGVLLSKTKTSESSSCGQFSCFVWIFDAHPENINRVDFVDGQGVSQPVTVGDMRQLDDATFNAGTNSGSFAEFEDTPNKLHYYILDKSTDANGVLTYTVGIKSLDGAGPQTRGVAVPNAPAQAIADSGSNTTCTFPVNNTGTAAATSTTAHPQGDVSSFVDKDIYRLVASASGTGWTAQLSNEFAYSKFGEGSSVPVYVTRTNGSSASSTVTLTATSVSDPSKTATATCAVTVDQPGVSSTIDPASPDGDNGWYKGSPLLHWTVTNANTTDCDDYTFTTDGAAVSRTCSATNDGGTTSSTKTIKRDATKPTTGSSLSPAAPDGLNGWYVTNPTVTLTASDATSGVATIRSQVDGGAWRTYTGPFPFCGVPPNPPTCGNHGWGEDAIDVAGNVSDTVSHVTKVDLNNPTSASSISPAAQNGWFASPTVTLTGDDGASGSGIDHISYKIDGEAGWHTYAGPLSGFTTGNHFVQFQATDVSGRVETALNLIAFKADGTKPSVNITKPAAGASYPLDKPVAAAFKCTDKDSGIASCVGTVADGANIDTSTIGDHTFTVTGTDKAGNVTVVTNHYTVTFTFNGFFNPVSNTGDSELNLAHAGDLLKVGFGLNGDRGLNVGTVTSSTVACPAWTPHTVSAAGAGSTGGLSYGAASGHYTYGWQTSAGWAGTCREFTLTLNDGSVHKATFMFFA